MLNRETQRRLLSLSTPLLTDARVRLDLPETFLDPGIRPVVPFSKMAGTAVTARLKKVDDPSEADLSPIMTLYQSQEKSSCPLIVIEIPEELHRYGIFGGGAAAAASTGGFVGALIEGAVRDSAELREVNYPAFSRTISPGYIVFISAVESVGEPVTVGGRLIHNGDIIVGDNDGVLAIKPDELDSVLAKGEAIAEWEDKVHKLLLKGADRDEIFEAAGQMP
jgi:regulator of RNase E activity RraA